MLRDHQQEIAMAAVTDFLSNVTKWTRAREEKVASIIPFWYCESFFVSCIRRCPLRTSRSNWRNTGEMAEGQTCDSTMRAIQNHRWCYCSFPGLLIQITKGRACPIFTVDTPLVSSLLTDEFWSHNGQHLYFSGGFPSSSASLLLLSWEFSLLGSMEGGMAEESAQLTGLDGLSWDDSHWESGVSGCVFHFLNWTFLEVALHIYFFSTSLFIMFTFYFKLFKHIYNMYFNILIY